MADHRLAVDGEYVSVEDSADPDTARAFDELIDSMKETESADAWITVMRIPMDAMGNPLPNTKGASQLFAEVMGSSTIPDLIERVRRDFIRPNESSITVRIIGKQQGKSGLKFNKVFKIERANKPAAEASKEGMADIARVVMDMQRASDERVERLAQSLQSRVSAGSPAADPIDQMTKMMAAMGAMMGAMMQGRPMGAPAGGSAADELMKVISVAQKLGVMGGGPLEEKEEGLTEIIKAVAGPALNFFAAQKQHENLKLAQGAQNRPVRRLAPPQKIPPAAPIDTRDPDTIIPPVDPTAQRKQEPALAGKEIPVELAQLKSALSVIAGMAEKKDSPIEVAKLVLNAVPQADESDFYDQIVDDAYVSQCILLEPRLEPHRQWLEQVRAEMLAQFQPDDVSAPAANDPGPGARTDE